MEKQEEYLRMTKTLYLTELFFIFQFY